LVIGELYIVNRPAALPALLVPQQQLDHAPTARNSPYPLRGKLIAYRLEPHSPTLGGKKVPLFLDDLHGTK
jgi:hypothetical protein